MSATIDPTKRTASYPAGYQGPVTLMNCFIVPDGRDQAFEDTWTRTSVYFRAQPGFESLRLHRALSPDAQYRFVNIANWASLAEFQAAHNTPEFRTVVSGPEWSKFPSSPTLYQVITEHPDVRMTAATPFRPSGIAAEVILRRCRTAG